MKGDDVSGSPDNEDTEDNATADVAGLPTTGQVIAYLERNLDFLAENPDLLRRLTPPDRHENDQVVDMQRFMVDRLQAQLDQMNDNQSELIETTRSNMSSQAQIHRAVLSLLDATDFEHLVHIATHDLSQILDIDVVTLCIEPGGAAPDLSGKGIYILQPGTVDSLLGDGRDILLRETISESDTIFGPAAALVQSDARVRLDLEDFSPAAMLALGSREPSRFHPGQGTELLSFMAEALRKCILLWRKTLPS